MNYTKLYADLRKHEARRDYLYDDKDPDKTVMAPLGKYTIGVGHNIEDNGLSEAVIDLMLEEDIQIAISACRHLFPSWSSVDEIRQTVLVNMSFNLGLGRLAGFRRMIAAVNKLDWQTAAAEMLDSKWATQVGKRARELANEMRGGIDV